MPDPVSRLIAISKAPIEREAFEAWLKMDDLLAFMRNNALESEFVIYASTGRVFMDSVIVPSASVNPTDIDDVMSWNSPLSSSWGISVTFGKPATVSIVPPGRGTGSKTLDGGEALVFGRSFEGRVGNKSYYEVPQKFTQLFDLHWLEDRSAFCRINKYGDIEDIIRVIRIPARGTEYGGTIITFTREVLDDYLILADSVIARMFDFTCFRSGDFSGWSDNHDVRYTRSPNLFYRSHIEPGHASYMRGEQIVGALANRDAVLKRYSSFGEPEDREYASFIAWDWKNKTVREISSAPGETANYFTESQLPFEVSPAFFRPEVLSKYKADTEKYQLQDRSISCRGAWHLQAYDFNEAGQVHTYIVYLRSLPYEEQLYWKAHNELPKGGISKRACTTDFEGTWDQTYEPLSSLKAVLREWNRAQVPWWELRSEDLPDHVHYPVTDSHNEWANEILSLDQLVVEGFETKWLRSLAQRLGKTPDPAMQSLGLLEQCLVALGYPDDVAEKIVAPLKRAHYLRSKMKGHASGDEAILIRKQSLADHGSYKAHYRVLAGQVDESIRSIEAALEKTKAASAASAP